jgi:hypothetical protein
VDYVLDVKPYHTKVLEIWVEYIYNDRVKGTVKDALDMEIYMDFDRRRPCKYGWDTTPWDMFWNVDSVSDIVKGSFFYSENGVSKSVAKFDAYRLFFQYLTDRWKWRIGEQEEPVISSAAENPYRLLSFAPVMNGCTAYWQTMAQDNQFWLDPRLKRLYKRIGSEWAEQPFFYSMNEPQGATEGEYWFSTSVSKLYTRLVDGWAEINKVYLSYDVPEVPPTYPENWKSNWDYPVCGAPYGETHIHARVTDLLTFEHGTEIFLFDHVRTAIVDPTGRDVSQSEYSERVQRMEHPIKFRTRVIQTSRYRYKLQREEISILTEPDNPEIANTSWTIDLDGYDVDGWDIERVRKDVKLGSFLTWTHTEQGTKLIEDNLINQQTFRMRVQSGKLVAQKNDGNTLVDVDVPWANGTVVYVRSTGDLPEYNLPQQDSHKRMALHRYRPYRVVRSADNRLFSLALADLNTLAVDVDVMGGLDQLSFLTPGTGRMYIGIGYPVPFMEIRTHLHDTIASKKIRDNLSSSMEAFLGQKYLEIVDVLLGYTGSDNVPRNGFVIEGNFPSLAAGTEIKVVNSHSPENNGEWLLTHNQVWDNVWQGFTADGSPIPKPAPSWWDSSQMGAWPVPTKKPQAQIDYMVAVGEYQDEYSEYNYDFFTTLGVAGPPPTDTQRLHGYVALDQFNFTDGQGQNKAAVTVADQLLFGSLKAIQNEDGTTSFVREAGVPGVSLSFKESINATIQEGLVNADPYGGPSIGSYDITYFDQDTYDENLATLAVRLQNQ